MTLYKATLNTTTIAWVMGAVLFLSTNVSISDDNNEVSVFHYGDNFELSITQYGKGNSYTSQSDGIDVKLNILQSDGTSMDFKMMCMKEMGCAATMTQQQIAE